MNVILTIVTSIIVLSSCGDNDFQGSNASKKVEGVPAMGAESGSESVDMGEDGVSSESMSKKSPESPAEGGETSNPDTTSANTNRAGLLTAGTFDDGLNFEAFKKFWQKQGEGQNLTDASLPPLNDIQPKARLGGPRPEELEISFVIDTTGSMGDELQYLTSELSTISKSIKDKFPAKAIRWSSVLYRDHGDDYVVKTSALDASVDRLKKFLAAESANGGGDYPEAMDAGLDEAAKLQWSGEKAGKLIFLIADAPPHSQNTRKVFQAMDNFARKNIKIYPIAASGSDTLTEKIMRYGAVVSGGEYIFLTDDSGIGGAHAEPHIPCYQVRKLNRILAQKIEEEITQIRIEPTESEVLRSVGKQEQGVCK